MLKCVYILIKINTKKQMIIESKAKWISTILLIIAVAMVSVASAKEATTNSLDHGQSDKLAREFLQRVSAQEFNEADKLIDFRAYSGRVAKHIFDSQAEQQNFVSGFTSGLQKSSFTKKIFVAAITAPTSYKYLGINDQGKPVIRMDYESGGHEYIKLILSDTPTGKPLIQDFLFASTGEYSTIGTANGVKYLIQPSESILKRLIGATEVNATLVNNFKKIGKLRAQGKLRESYDVIQTFPEELRNKREILNISINVASSFDESIYRSELSKLAKLYGHDSKLAFMLVDHYFYQEDWVKAIDALQLSKKEWVDDGVFNTSIAQMQLKNEKFTEAINSSELAIKREPENEGMYWSALIIYNTAKKFNSAANILTILKDQFNYEFDAEEFRKDPDYSDFIQSDAFKSWFDE